VRYRYNTLTLHARENVNVSNKQPITGLFVNSSLL